jgi:para-aminobenzoate synthetase/4-amino-4-deoxychorismate lyase
MNAEGPFASLPMTILHAPRHGGYLKFRRPVGVLAAWQPGEIPDLLREVEAQVNDAGRFAAGFLSYEAAPAFDPAMRVRPDPNPFMPLAWFGLYQNAEAYTLPPEHVGLPDSSWQSEVSSAKYRQNLHQIKAYIARGDTYQVNYTYRLRSAWAGPVQPAFNALAAAHRAPYAAFLEDRDWAICSLSPELFFALDGDLITSRPMKGTAPRGRWTDEDYQLAAWLRHSEKNQAENVMIVDMVRNDLGRIARTGSVCVPELFTIEKYLTLWQMTSSVQARSQAGFFELFQALFPCASITGAPKIRTMEIIAGLETSPRRVYTGAIGFFAPGRQAQFNVAIRTLLVDRRAAQAEYAVGGGIVWDSQAEDEWAETKTKAKVLSELPQPFELLETMRWAPPEGWFLLDEHLGRLASSAEYFDYPLDIEAVRARLDRLAAGFQEQPQRVRLLLDRNGMVRLEAAPLGAGPAARTVGLAARSVPAAERFLYHKTTRREIYARARAEAPEYDEVLLWNERGELTEATIANVILEQGGQWYTPPVECGLLPGTFRARLLADGRVQEQVIPVATLADYERIYLANSVWGLWEVALAKPGSAVQPPPGQV